MPSSILPIQGQVSATARRFPVERTLFIVSSKSGGTAEVNAFLDFFWARARRKLGEKAAQHFIAITDPGTSLDKLAGERKFRRIFAGDPGCRRAVLCTQPVWSGSRGVDRYRCGEIPGPGSRSGCSVREGHACRTQPRPGVRRNPG